ncbi:hypothetical protein BHF71_10845 [Vulcanibacillus modesticaldus]|uniref:Lipoprotein n=1 Tax=Vulcanibacillus modesticaldus TaxID=337097 RepID=A0A1D2YT26_9BACI|nr:hypothetical protein [Vulcanibacillus modesticaldus]OEF98816.1 hypothetical protein BHF71_10845 [Vulcanibacillus modesticaldus]
MNIIFKFLYIIILSVLLTSCTFQIDINSPYSTFEEEIKMQIDNVFDENLKEIVHTDIKESGLLIFYTSYDSNSLSFTYVTNDDGKWVSVYSGYVTLNEYSYILTANTGMPFNLALVSAPEDVDNVTVQGLPLKHIISNEVSFWYIYTERPVNGADIDFYSNGEKVR